MSALMTLLRADLLEGHGVALAGPAGEGIAAALQDLGARVQNLDDGAPAQEQDVGRWAGRHGPFRALVFDARTPFGGGGPQALISTMHQAWLAIREVATGTLIDSAEPGKVVLIGPGLGAGTHSEALCAALENLARTLSVEWARYGVTTVMVAPRAGLEDSRLAELVCFLCSPGADYVSGTRLDVG